MKDTGKANSTTELSLELLQRCCCAIPSPAFPRNHHPRAAFLISATFSHQNKLKHSAIIPISCWLLIEQPGCTSDPLRALCRAWKMAGIPILWERSRAG